MQVMVVKISLYIHAVWSVLWMLVLTELIDTVYQQTVNALIRPHESMCWPEPLLIAPEGVATYFFLFLNKKTYVVGTH